ncbi:MAG: RNA-binding cell elongation regulator Jag/EloR [Chloroflexota bacterium]
MDSNKFVETTGDSVEEAIAKGLAELGVGPTEVIVEVLEEGRRGVFGLGGQPAKVRLQLMNRPKPEAFVPSAPPRVEDELIELPSAPAWEAVNWDPTPEAELASAPSEQAPRERQERPEHRDRPERSERPPRTERPARTPKPADDYQVSDEDTGMVVVGDEVPETDQDDEAQIAKVVLNELLEKMEISGRIVVRKAQAADPEESVPWVLDVVGSNLSRLIGRRGETLASLQYITRLITSRELQRRSEVVVDIAGYKARRAQTLHALALRMADDAIERDQVVTLEPMPPHERRIVHLALRGRTDVVTRSIGEGVSRKVTIVPSSQA